MGSEMCIRDRSKPGTSSTWVNSQRKFTPYPGHFSVEINSLRLQPRCLPRALPLPHSVAPFNSISFSSGVCELVADGLVLFALAEAAFLFEGLAIGAAATPFPEGAFLRFFHSASLSPPPGRDTSRTTTSVNSRRCRGRASTSCWPSSVAVSYTHLTLPTNREV